jgi:hypothetical protein
MDYSSDLIRRMAKELYGLDVAEPRAAEMARQLTRLTTAAGKAELRVDFDDPMASINGDLVAVRRQEGGS